MSDQQPRPDRPVLTGLVALVAVALAVGGVLAVVVLLGTRFLGVGGTDAAGSDSTVRESMFLPSPLETEDSRGPLITLNTQSADADVSASASDDLEPSPSESTSPADGQISLQASATQVAVGERIYFSGVYTGGEGAILFVQRLQDGAWVDFPASVGVTGGQFSSYLFTGVSGENRFRVVDRDTGVTSNEISVQVG